MTRQETDQHKVSNAVIMAAGLSSRFAPLSYEYPKALVEVKGEILIERQIRQLKEVGIHDITVVVGYKKELFNYLIKKFQVELVENPEYNERNNHSSLYYAREKLGNTYICSADNYFTENIFESHVNRAYYSAVFEQGKTDEWTIKTDETGLITDVKIGGYDSWVMFGPVFFSLDFSNNLIAIIEKVYDIPETASLLWESIYVDHIKELDMYIRKYSRETIFEFDSLDELREFDERYYNDTGSEILKELSKKLSCQESDFVAINPLKKNDETIGFEFSINFKSYEYIYKTKLLTEK